VNILDYMILAAVIAGPLMLLVILWEAVMVFRDDD
jgi:nitrogen fixation-related uncharacterized protein